MSALRAGGSRGTRHETEAAESIVEPLSIGGRALGGRLSHCFPAVEERAELFLAPAQVLEQLWVRRILLILEVIEDQVGRLPRVFEISRVSVSELRIGARLRRARVGVSGASGPGAGRAIGGLICVSVGHAFYVTGLIGR